MRHRSTACSLPPSTPCTDHREATITDIMINYCAALGFRRRNHRMSMPLSSGSSDCVRKDMFPWYSSAMLALESNHVIGLRLTKFALGGSGAGEEANLMVAEKIAATVEAFQTLLKGGNIFIVIDRYREHVTANATRLAG